MPVATLPIDTPERSSDVISIPVAAATLLNAGWLIAIDTSGNAVPASDTTLLVVIGRCEADADNSAGAAGDISVSVKRGCFRFANDATNAVDPDDKGKWAFVTDNQTVAETSTHKVKAGRVIAVDSNGVWVDTRSNFLTQVDSITGAADLAALKTALVALLGNPSISLIK